MVVVAAELLFYLQLFRVVQMAGGGGVRRRSSGGTASLPEGVGTAARAPRRRFGGPPLLALSWDTPELDL